MGRYGEILGDRTDGVFTSLTSLFAGAEQRGGAPAAAVAFDALAPREVVEDAVELGERNVSRGDRVQ